MKVERVKHALHVAQALSEGPFTLIQDGLEGEGMGDTY
jgi:hypothetical protein